MSVPSRICPLCRKPTVESANPFCSSRCATLDLGRWLSEGYKIEAPETDEDETALDKTNPSPD
jgi:endogenous inhibitor of DNA gyrase (YacG/DUF329 family)